jgi:pimeloyl-ACP methyl ester carboxylesterase
MSVLALSLAAFAFVLPACERQRGPGDDRYPWIDTLETGAGAKPAGRRLMSLPGGLSRIDRAGERTLLIAVHGYRSEGYEWVEPLKTLDDADNEVHFYRWDWTRCPSDVAAGLSRAISDRLEAEPLLERVILLGHSLGGLVVAELAYGWQGAAPLEAHVIAAPLQMAGADPRCPGPPLAGRSLAPQSGLVQWRTRQELDGAFRRFGRDPQQVDLPGSPVTLLPETYRGRRLGHNWSVSWVAETLSGATPPG